jgi:hypothetical protein
MSCLMGLWETRGKWKETLFWVCFFSHNGCKQFTWSDSNIRIRLSWDFSFLKKKKKPMWINQLKFQKFGLFFVCLFVCLFVCFRFLRFLKNQTEWMRVIFLDLTQSACILDPFSLFKFLEEKRLLLKRQIWAGSYFRKPIYRIGFGVVLVLREESDPKQ